VLVPRRKLVLKGWAEADSLRTGVRPEQPEKAAQVCRDKNPCIAASAEWQIQQPSPTQADYYATKGHPLVDYYSAILTFVPLGELCRE
jgi:hypothetical protein